MTVHIFRIDLHPVYFYFKQPSRLVSKRCEHWYGKRKERVGILARAPTKKWLVSIQRITVLIYHLSKIKSNSCYPSSEV